MGVIALVDALHAQNGGGSKGASVVAPVSTSVPPVSTTTAATSPAPANTTKPPAPRTTAPKPVATPPPSATTLQVFNVSRHSGLAQSEATRLRAAGYLVSRVANKKGVTIAATTVYYDAGDVTEQAEARGVVARGLASVAAARPASVAAASGTLILYVT